MVYVKGDGTVVERNPFSLFGWFWAIVDFLYLLLMTLINPTFNKHGDKYSRDFRPPGSGSAILVRPIKNSGNIEGRKKMEHWIKPELLEMHLKSKMPPKPPTRKFGGFGPSGSGPSPPPMGGGCGCG